LEEVAVLMGKKYSDIETFSHTAKYIVDCQQVVTVNDKMLTYEIGAMEIRGEKLLG